MRTSLRETERIEEHLLGVLEPGEQLLFQAQLLLDGTLMEKTASQQKAYALIRSYGRKALRQEIADVEAQLFELPAHKSFKERILSLFPKK